MTLRSKFILYCLVIHAVLLGLVVKLFPENTFLFIGGELFILLSIGASVWLYRSSSRPLQLIAAGIQSIREEDFNTRLVKTGHREMDELIEVYNQMIDQLREERLKHTEKNYFLEKLIQASPSGMIVLDLEGKLATVNPAAARMLAYSPEIHGPVSLEELPGKLPQELSALPNGESRIIRINGFQTFKCQKSHFIDRGFPRYFILIEELTEEIHRQEKKAYEKVIRMMSHEINNSIGAINSILNTCITYKDQLQSEYSEDYENALQVAVRRNTGLSSFMSNFAKVVRVPEPIKVPVDLHALLHSVQPLMQAYAHERQKLLTWEWQLETKLVRISADVQQMEQVLVNVLKNAIEAIEQEGSITIITQAVPCQLTISDNGRGIPKEVSGQLFSPFFSTKKNGQGIGLTLTKEILVNHGFRFSLETKPAGQTEFTIYF